MFALTPPYVAPGPPEIRWGSPWESPWSSARSTPSSLTTTRALDRLRERVRSCQRAPSDRHLTPPHAQSLRAREGSGTALTRSERHPPRVPHGRDPAPAPAIVRAFAPAAEQAFEQAFEQALERVAAHRLEEEVERVANSVVKRLEPLLERHLRERGVLSALGPEALLPLNEVLAASGISRDVGERMRERGEVLPVVLDPTSKNPRLYVTVGAWRRLVRALDVAPPPSKSKLSRAKHRAQERS